MEKYTLQEEKQIFLNTYWPGRGSDDSETIALTSAINSAVRHNPTYTQGLTHQHKQEAIEFWREQLLQKGEKYLTEPQTLETYLTDVIEIRDAINSRYRCRFYNNVSEGIRIAHCQKSFAIYLKYRWCQSTAMPTPPACPVDRTILEECRIRNIAWTRMDDINSLRQLLDSIGEATKEAGLPLAEWELRTFNRFNNPKL